jgi:hypothetical protein
VPSEQSGSSPDCEGAATQAQGGGYPNRHCPSREGPVGGTMFESINLPAVLVSSLVAFIKARP